MSAIKPAIADSNWIYIYYIAGTDVVYDRSLPRENCLLHVESRIKNLREQGREAFYTIGITFPGAFV